MKDKVQQVLVNSYHQVTKDERYPDNPKLAEVNAKITAFLDHLDKLEAEKDDNH